MSALKVGGNTQYTLMELSKLNHLFQVAETGFPSEYAQIEQTFASKALELISSSVLEQAE